MFDFAAGCAPQTPRRELDLRPPVDVDHLPRTVITLQNNCLVSIVDMATIAALWTASCATLYAQLKDEKTLGAVLAKAEAFLDQPPLLQANLAAVAALSFLLVLKVRSRADWSFGSEREQCDG